MSGLRLIAFIFIAVGILGLIIGRFSFVRETHDADLGPIEVSVSERETVNIPTWAGIGAIVVGGVLLLANRRNV
jgi:hypothetical protein